VTAAEAGAAGDFGGLQEERTVGNVKNAGVEWQPQGEPQAELGVCFMASTTEQLPTTYYAFYDAPRTFTGRAGFCL
jgi:hypothetical protein